MIILETERLYIRKFNLDDAAFNLELMNTRGWLENIGDRNIKSIEDARKYIQDKMIASYEQFGFGMYVVENKSDGKAIGSAGLVKRDFLDHVDIGFALLDDYQNKGFAYEASAAIKVYAMDQLGQSTILGVTIPSNLPSRRLLEKLGLSCVKEIVWPKSEEILLLYST